MAKLFIHHHVAVALLWLAVVGGPQVSCDLLAMGREVLVKVMAMAMWRRTWVGVAVVHPPAMVLRPLPLMSWARLVLVLATAMTTWTMMTTPMTTMITRTMPRTTRTMKTMMAMMMSSWGRQMPPRKTKTLTKFACWLVLYAPTRIMAWAQWCPCQMPLLLFQPPFRLWSCRCPRFSPPVCSCMLGGSLRRTCLFVFTAGAGT